MVDSAVNPGVRPATPVSELPGVGPRRAAALARLDIQSVSDLIRHFPMRYEWESAEGTINDLPSQGMGATRGTLVATRWIPGPGKGRFQATLEDHETRLNLVWFSAGYMRDRLHPGMTIRVQGKVKSFDGYSQMVNPHWEPLDEADAAQRLEERYRPIYPATDQMPSARIEELVDLVLPAILPQLVDPLPEDFVRRHAMPPLSQAFAMIHRPAQEEEQTAARRRLAYNELLLLQLGIALKRHHARTHLAAPSLRWSLAVDAHIRQRFGFKLTPAQDHVIEEIVADLRQSKPMNRLLQGDVGSGKTVVALYALLMAVSDNKQGALMVPTELLAEQHYASLGAMLEGSNVRLGLLTAGQGGRAELEQAIETGEIDIIIGTQALLTQSVRFHDLALVVVDEQHRFGVMQRAAFRNRGAAPSPDPDGRQPSPHALIMTATPIPRTLNLTIFGDLDVSIIQGLPPGRSPIVTRVVEPAKADEVYRYMAKRLAQGEQAYVVLPTIDAQGHESAAQLKNVRAHLKLLQDKYCQGMNIAAVHGRLSRDTREAVMQKFRQGRIQALVATTVIEVGVDVPNATMMIVEHAERFGLAQLHQLRGRIGRRAGGPRSVCVFIAEPSTPEAAQRMTAIASTSDGFVIAEQDLLIRGMGDFFGTRQHGLPPLRVAKIPEQDMELLHLAKIDALQIVASDPNLAYPRWRLLRQVLLQQYGDALGLIDVG